MSRIARLLWFAVLGGTAVAILLAIWSWREARAGPFVRRATIVLAGWPERAPPVRAVLISDIHIGTAAMDGARLERIVDQVNALSPDLVLIAGDFIYGHEPDSAVRLGAPLVAPLSRIDAPLGVFAAVGNHDHWTGRSQVAALMARAGVTMLENEAVAAGPLAIGVVGDKFSGNADLPRTLARLREVPGARVLLTHSPDIAPALGPGSLLLAGHTHCGQIVLPLWGPPVRVSRYGERYRCGIAVEEGRAVITTAGLGTSALPLRFGAPPDLWLLTLGP